MKNFSEWMAEQPGMAQGDAAAQPKKPVEKKWKATKDQIVQYWRSLRPDTPIQMTPIQYSHDGTTYAEDGVRITGSQQFIGSVLSRLKEFLNFESPQTKLQLVYRETESPSQAFATKTSFVFYIQTKERGGGAGASAGVPKLPKPKKIEPPKPPTI